MLLTTRVLESALLYGELTLCGFTSSENVLLAGCHASNSTSIVQKELVPVCTAHCDFLFNLRPLYAYLLAYIVQE